MASKEGTYGWRASEGEREIDDPRFKFFLTVPA